MKVRIDSRDLITLLQYLKKAPRKFAAAQGMWVNRAAFGTRDNVLQYMHSKMIIRSDAFLKSRIKVQKAKRGSLKADRAAIVGSVRAARHTSWAEQEGLKEDKRDKVLTLESRGGNRRKRVRPSLRMKKGKAYPKPTQFEGKTKRQRANNMLQIIGRTRSRKPFILFGHRTLPSGLWRFGSGPKGRRDLIPVQLFGTEPARPKKSPWLTSSVARYFREINTRAVWHDIIRRIKASPKK